jgi:toxin CptA
LAAPTARWCSSAFEFKLQPTLSKHNAPSVVYPLGRSRFQGQILLVLWLVALATIGLWMAHAQAWGWRHGLGVLALVLAGAAALMGWKNSPVGQLAWDGQTWHWESRGYQAGAAEHDVSVVCDFQSFMLLRIDNPDQARLWLWAERTMFADRWLDMRRAVYSPRRTLGREASPA